MMVHYIRIHRGTHHVARDYARCASIHMASCSQSPKQLPAPPLHLRRSMRQIGSRASRCRETRSEYHASCCVRACVHVRLYFWCAMDLARNLDFLLRSANRVRNSGRRGEQKSRKFF